MDMLEQEFTKEVENNNIEKVSKLLESNKEFNIDFQDDRGNTMLHIVKSPEMAELLLKNGINATIQNNDGMTAFGKFFERIYIINMERICDSLLKNGIDINAAAYYDEAPVTKIANNSATLTTNIEQMSYLLKNKADINIKNSQGYTPLMLSVMKNNIDMVRLLLDSGADANILDNKGRNAKKIGEDMMATGYFAPALKTIISLL